MVYVAVGVALFLWGVLVGRVGQKLGTILALVPVLLWCVLMAWFSWSGMQDSPAGDTLPAYLLIGLLAFLAGSNLTSRFLESRKAHNER